MTLTFAQTREANSLRDEFEFTAKGGSLQCHNHSNSTSYEIKDGNCTCPDYVYRCYAKGEKCKHLVALDRIYEMGYEVVGDAHAPDMVEQPDPEWIIGRCPECGEPTVSNAYHIGGKGYIIREECWNSLTGPTRPVARCSYRRVR